MSLQQSLVSYRKEWEPVEIILIVHFHSLGETGAGVARRDQADQHTMRFGAVPPPSLRPLGNLESVAASSVRTSPVKPS